MSDLRATFEQASQDIHKLTSRPSNEQLLSLYAFYKQATEGDVKGSRPGMLDLKGRAKFDAWTKIKGTGAEAAMQRYVDLAHSLLGKK